MVGPCAGGRDEAAGPSEGGGRGGGVAEADVIGAGFDRQAHGEQVAVGLGGLRVVGTGVAPGHVAGAFSDLPPGLPNGGAGRM